MQDYFLARSNQLTLQEVTVIGQDIFRQILLPLKRARLAVSHSFQSLR